MRHYTENYWNKRFHDKQNYNKLKKEKLCAISDVCYNVASEAEPTEKLHKFETCKRNKTKKTCITFYENVRTFFSSRQRVSRLTPTLDRTELTHTHTHTQLGTWKKSQTREEKKYRNRTFSHSLHHTEQNNNKKNVICHLLLQC